MLIFKARYAWQLPVAGLGVCLLVNFILRGGGMQGGVVMGTVGLGIMGGFILGGLVCTVMGFIKETPRGKISNKIHSVVGLWVNGFLVLMIIGGLLAGG